MKKTSAIKSFGLALAAAASLSTPVQSINKSNSKSHQTVNKDAIHQKVKSSRQIVRESAGGLNVIQVGLSSRPPHIYGQYYVKRGTHKRTNK